MPGKPITSFTSTTHPVSSCILCKSERHPLYACSKFKALPHDKMISTLKSNGICMNCLGPGHFVKQYKSLHRYKKCQKPHHSLLHLEERDDSHSTLDPVSSDPTSNVPSTSTLDLPSHATTGLKSDSLLMTCRVLVSSLDSNCPPVETRAILDSASSASFISERLAQSLCLPRLHQSTKITGVACLSRKSPIRSITKFGVSATQSPRKTVEVTAVVVPRVTCNLPVHPDSRWNHLSDVKLAAPDFGRPGKIDILLGVEVFVDVLLHGQRIGPPNSPVAFETEFGWVLAGKTSLCSNGSCCYSSSCSLFWK